MLAHFRSGAWALLPLVAAAAWFLGGSPTATASGGLSFVPRVGGPHATFVAQFVAPFRVLPDRDPSGENVFYFLNVSGPCRTDLGVSNFDHLHFEPGDRATLVTSADEVGGEWCPGRYVGRITYERFPGSGPSTVVRTLFSGFTFRVLPRDRLRRLAARPDAVKVFPRIGTPRETFLVRFTAPYRTGGRHESQYEFSGRGPRPCRSVWDTPVSEELVRGDRAVFALDSAAIGKNGRRRWCPGRYRGHVNYLRFNHDGDVVLRRRVVSNIRFTVRRG